MNNTFPMCTKRDLHFTAGNSNCVGPISKIQASQRNQCLLGVRSTELTLRDVGQYYGPDSFEQCSSWSEILLNGSRLRLQPFWLWFAPFPILCLRIASQIIFKNNCAEGVPIDMWIASLFPLTKASFTQV